MSAQAPSTGFQLSSVHAPVVERDGERLFFRDHTPHFAEQTLKPPDARLLNGQFAAQHSGVQVLENVRGTTLQLDKRNRPERRMALAGVAQRTFRAVRMIEQRVVEIEENGLLHEALGFGLGLWA